MKKEINIVNRKAAHEYFFTESFEAGVTLVGTEVKSIRIGNANLSDAYCLFLKGELWIKNLHISEYKYGAHNNHEPKRDRKLLLNKRELNKINRRVTEKGLAVVPYRVYLSERGFIKIEIKLAQGKKSYDKRATIKDRENKRELDRVKKMDF